MGRTCADCPRELDGPYAKRCPECRASRARRLGILRQRAHVARKRAPARELAERGWAEILAAGFWLPREIRGTMRMRKGDD